MKRYHLDVITGTNQGGSNGVYHYEIDADGYEYSEKGFYRFYVKENKDDIWDRFTKTIASYPINRTIIKSIEEV